MRGEGGAGGAGLAGGGPPPDGCRRQSTPCEVPTNPHPTHAPACKCSDFWGRSNGLPRAMADCTALTKLSVQCSSGLGHYKVLASLRSLANLSVVDCDWAVVPAELLRLPLTRLHLRFADFASPGWLPADAARLAGTLEVLELPGCQIKCGRGARWGGTACLASPTACIQGAAPPVPRHAPVPPARPCSAVPEELCQLTGLTRLSLERNYVRELPAALTRLRALAALRCTVQRGLQRGGLCL